MSSFPRSFRPPHCPNPGCDFHLRAGAWRYRRHGFYLRKARPVRIPRYRCSHCGRTFSSQTFSLTYWLKRPTALARVYEGLIACSAYRQMARALEISPSTVQHHATRLGRHAFLFLASRVPRRAPREPVVVDGFETFEHSQYHPFHAQLAVGADSHFLYAFTDAELRRKGRMTRAQRRRRAVLEARFGRPDPKAIEREMVELLRLVAPRGSELVVRSDEHPAYPRAFSRLKRWRIQHQMTPSQQARTTRNPLFPVNRMDLLLRHSSANHKRETIAFSKRRQSAMERIAIFAVWVNFQKSRSEKKRNATPAQVLGLARCRLSTDAFLSRRLFPSIVSLPERWQRYYRREIPTRARRCAPAPTRRYAV